MNRLDTISNLKIALKEYPNSPVKDFSKELEYAIYILEELDKKHIIAIDKDADKDIINKLNDLIEYAFMVKNTLDDNNIADDNLTNNNLIEFKDSIEDILCFFDIDTHCNIVDNKNNKNNKNNKLSPYIITLKEHKNG